MKIILTLFYSFCVLLANARQEKPVAIIAGNVIDGETRKALAGATVSLKKMGDSARSISQVADEDGAFLFEQVAYGYYSLQVKASGYAPLRIDSIYVREDRTDFNLTDIKLNRSVNDLESVTVYAEKPLIENKDGKIIFNASESALSNASNATELLKQTPLVSTDNDGKMLMKGKEVKILIDDKPVDMDARQLQDLLESMPGSMIEKIEVLTTPPAEYANERGGVINIVTKKGKIGKSGRINLNYGTRGEAGISGSYNYRKNKISLNITAGYSYNKYKGNSYSMRENFYTDSSNFFKTDGTSINSNNRPNVRFNMDYALSKYQSFSATVNVNSRTGDAESDTWYSNLNQYDVLYRLSDRLVTTQSDALNPSATVSYLKKGKTSGRNLRITGSLAYSETDNLRDFYQQYLNVDSSYNGKDSSQRQQTLTSSWNRSLRINYDMPLRDKKTILNFGATSSYYTLNNELITSFLKKPDNIFIPNDLLSNDFDFFQTVHSVRAAVRYTFKKDFFINVGMQQDFTKTHFDIKGDDRHYPNEYWSSLPFANLTRKWENGYSITASYKRTIQRPGINNLNPSVDYSDPYNTRFGNPYLQPYFADNFDLGAGYWKKKFNINFSVGYNTLQDIYSSLRSLDTSGKTFTSWYNLSGRKEYEASMFGGVNIGKKLKLNASANYTYNVYSSYDRKERGYHNGSSINSSMNGNYTFSPLMNFTGNLAFNRFANPQGSVRNRVSMTLGMQRKFLEKKLVVSLNIVDPFSQQQNTNFIETPRYNLETFSQSNSRNLRIAVAYNFSKKPKKKISAQKKAALDKLKANLPKNN